MKVLISFQLHWKQAGCLGINWGGAFIWDFPTWKTNLCAEEQKTAHTDLGLRLGYQPRITFAFCHEYSAKHPCNMTANLQISANYCQLDEIPSENKHASGQYIFFLVLTLLLGTEMFVTGCVLFNFWEDIRRVSFL